MKLTRSAATLGLTLLSASALALPLFVQDFAKTYKMGTDTAIAKAGCAVCHVGHTKALNPYGLDMQKEMKAENTKKLTPEVFKKIEGLDSDKDGVKNGDEIKAGTLPGDPKSVPPKKKK